MISTNERKQEDAFVITPREDAMEGMHVIETSIVYSGQKYHAFDHAEYPDEGGIYVHYKGMPYPRKGFPFPEAVHANDVLKRVTMTMLKSVAVKQLALAFFGFAILPWKMKEKIMDNAFANYCRISGWLMAGFYLKENRYSNPCRSIRKMVGIFFADLGISRSDEIAKVVATIFEYDDAYRYRLEDIMSEASSVELRHNPRQEIKRLLAIFAERELAEPVKATLKAVSLVASVVFLHPRIKRAFTKAMLAMSPKDLLWLRLDTADRYHVLIRNDYNFMGLPFSVRRNMYIDFHTHSKCCNTGVVERRIGDKKWETICKKCKNKCEFYQEFPPEVEVASYKM